MGLGLGIILVAVGAILAWAVSVDTTGFDVNTIGIILFIVGIVSILLSMVFWSSWAGAGAFRAGPGGYRRKETVIREDEPTV